MPPKSSRPKSVTFGATIRQTGNNTGIVVPPSVLAELDAGQCPPVLVDINGYRYRTTVGVMRGDHLVSVSAAVRSETGLKGNDDVQVTLTIAETPRAVDVPPDLEAAFTSQTQARTFFNSLSNGMQRFHIDHINGAKAAETRQRRIDKAVSLFLEGKQR